MTITLIETNATGTTKINYINAAVKNEMYLTHMERHVCLWIAVIFCMFIGWIGYIDVTTCPHLSIVLSLIHVVK